MPLFKCRWNPAVVATSPAPGPAPEKRPRHEQRQEQEEKRRKEEPVPVAPCMGAAWRCDPALRAGGERVREARLVRAHGYGHCDTDTKRGDHHAAPDPGTIHVVSFQK